MRDRVARVLLKLALAAFAGHRRDWANAMRAEFAYASEEGDALPFATGCLAAAWRDLPGSMEGRLIVSRYALAVLVLMPLAGLLLTGTYFGYPFVEPETGPGIAKAASGVPLFNEGNRSAVGVLGAMLVVRVICLTLLAWLIVERRWQHVGRLQALSVAVTMTFAIFCAVVMVDLAGMVLPALTVALELLATAHVRRQHGAEAAPEICWKE